MPVMIPLLILAGCSDGILPSTRVDTAEGRLQERLSVASAVVTSTRALRDDMIAISRAHDPASAVTSSERARLGGIATELERNRARVEDGGQGGVLNDRCVMKAVEASGGSPSLVTAVLNAENAALRYAGSVAAKASWFGAGSHAGESNFLGNPNITEKLAAVEPFEFEAAAAQASAALDTAHEYAAFAPFLLPCSVAPAAQPQAKAAPLAQAPPRELPQPPAVPEATEGDAPPADAAPLDPMTVRALGPEDLVGVASSELVERSGFRNAVARLFDDDVDTAWAEGVTGPGIGESFGADFGTPRVVRRVGIGPGHAKLSRKYGSLFPLNSRPSIVTLRVGEWEEKAELRDEPAVQWFTVPDVEASAVRIEIVAVYAGSRWPDTSVNTLAIEVVE